jgi:hypothetical protein
MSIYDVQRTGIGGQSEPIDDWMPINGSSIKCKVGSLGLTLPALWEKYAYRIVKKVNEEEDKKEKEDEKKKEQAHFMATLNRKISEQIAKIVHGDGLIDIIVKEQDVFKSDTYTKLVAEQKELDRMVFELAFMSQPSEQCLLLRQKHQHLSRLMVLLVQTCVATDKREETFDPKRYRVSILQCEISNQNLLVALLICLRQPSITSAPVQPLAVDFCGAFGEILPSWMNVQLTDNVDESFAMIWQNAKTIVDLGMGNGRLIIQLLLWKLFKSLPVVIHGFEADETRYRSTHNFLHQTREYLELMQPYFNFWIEPCYPTASNHTATIQTHSFAKNSEKSKDDSKASKDKDKNEPTKVEQQIHANHENGLTYKDVDQVDFFIFDIALDTKNKDETADQWRKFFSKTKPGAAVLVYHDHNTSIFPHLDWIMSPVTLPTTWSSYGGHRFYLCIRRSGVLLPFSARTLLPLLAKNKS